MSNKTIKTLFSEAESVSYDDLFTYNLLTCGMDVYLRITWVNRDRVLNKNDDFIHFRGGEVFGVQIESDNGRRLPNKPGTFVSIRRMPRAIMFYLADSSAEDQIKAVQCSRTFHFSCKSSEGAAEFKETLNTALQAFLDRCS